MVEGSSNNKVGDWLGKPLLVLGCAAAVYGSFLSSIVYNFDEGVYLWQAKRLLNGELPLRDFFHHQPPLYIYLIAPFAWLAGDAYIGARALSLAALLLSGWAVYRICREYYGERLALRLLILYFCLPLQGESLFAMPNALMVACAYTGLTLFLFGQSPKAWISAGALVAIAVYLKPLAAPFAAVLGVLAPFKKPRALAPYFLGSGVALALAGFIFFDVAAAGGFRDLLAIQNQRLNKIPVIERLAIYPPLAAEVERRGVSSDLQWNIYEHVASFFPVMAPVQILTPILAILAIFGICIGPIYLKKIRAGILLQGLIAAALLASSLFVWRPVWRHYMLQYLPALVVLAGAALCVLLTNRAARRAFDVALLVAGAFMIVNLLATSGSYQRLRALDLRDQDVLSFDPFVNVLTDSRPGCGLSDPLNEFGQASLLSMSPNGELSRFQVSPQQIAECIATSGVKILPTKWTAWFLTPEIAAALAAVPPERFVIEGVWSPSAEN